MAFASVDSINHRLKVQRKMLFVLGTNRFFLLLFFKQYHLGWELGCTPIMPVLRRLRQKNSEFIASPSFTERPV